MICRKNNLLISVTKPRYTFALIINLHSYGDATST